MLAVLATVALAAAPAQSSSYVLRASAQRQQLGGFTITKRPTLAGIAAAYGDPSACTLQSWYGNAVWRSLGFRVHATSLGVLPKGADFCTVSDDVKIASVIVTGKRWHTTKGLRVGDTYAKFRRLYPHAHRSTFGWSIVAVYGPCSIGVCSTRYVWAPRLTAAFRNGRVAEFVFPVGAQGE